MTRFFIIMAGGAGTRFWPASRMQRPKQFLDLDGRGETLLQAACRRAAAHVGLSHVLVVTSARHAEATRAQLPDLPRDNLLLEPVGRNTAPCIAWAVAHVERRASKDAIVGVLPADTHIGDEQAFASTLRTALQAAERDDIVTVGIRPSRPETGYGYIECGSSLGDGIRRVLAFTEKPDLESARAYQASGRHLWNSGMFFFRNTVMRRELRTHLPSLHAFVAELTEAPENGNEADIVQAAYGQLPAVSIDYGVMEKAQSVAVVPADFGWDDIGSWSAAWALAGKDDEQNAARGDALFLDSRGCYVSAQEGKLVALLGLEDVVVVDTDDALLVMPRSRAQDVRAVVQALQERGKGGHL